MWYGGGWCSVSISQLKNRNSSAVVTCSLVYRTQCTFPLEGCKAPNKTVESALKQVGKSSVYIAWPWRKWRIVIFLGRQGNAWNAFLLTANIRSRSSQSLLPGFKAPYSATNITNRRLTFSIAGLFHADPVCWTICANRFRYHKVGIWKE